MPRVNRWVALPAVLLIVGVVSYVGISMASGGSDTVSVEQCHEFATAIKTAVPEVAMNDLHTLGELGDGYAWTKDGCNSRLKASDVQHLIATVEAHPATPLASPTAVGQIGTVHRSN